MYVVYIYMKYETSGLAKSNMIRQCISETHSLKGLAIITKWSWVDEIKHTIYLQSGDACETVQSQ